MRLREDVPRWGRRARRSGDASGGVVERAAGAASPGGNTLLGALLWPGIASDWLRSQGRSLGHRCGAAPGLSSQGAEVERDGGDRRRRSPLAFDLPAAQFLCPRLDVLAEVSWRWTIHRVMASGSPPSTRGAHITVCRDCCVDLLDFIFCINQLSLAIEGARVLRAHPLRTGNTSIPRFPNCPFLGRAGGQVSALKLVHRIPDTRKRQPCLSKRRLFRKAISGADLLCFILLWSFCDFSWKRCYVFFLSLVFTGNPVRSLSWDYSQLWNDYKISVI